jgi:galactokinase
MATARELSAALAGGAARDILAGIYGSKPLSIGRQLTRYSLLVDGFSAAFPDAEDLHLFSAPGRTEVGGNHTDHNAGRVLAAAIDLDIAAVAAQTAGRTIIIESEGYPRHAVSLDELAAKDAEKYTAAAITRGVCARMRELGWRVGGFRARMTSAVPKGSGLSSSAAYEVLIVAILNAFYNEGRMPDIEAARIAQYAENSYFGKPCGLMDQTACAVGGLVAIDFEDPARPIVKKVDVPLAGSGFSVVIVDTGGSHAELNDEYAAIANEMRAVAQALGGRLLREFSRERVLENVALLREKAGDRAVLRALHFFDENQRVAEQVAALEGGRFDEFLRLVVESGRSSWMWCQNCYPRGAVQEQGIPLALAVSQSILGGRGAWRVHGGGFAGTIQAFVPDALLEGFLRAIRGIFGEASCHELAIRPVGTRRLDIG